MRTLADALAFAGGNVPADVDWVAYAKLCGVEGFMHPSELARLVELADGKNYCEIGSYRGLSAWCVAHTAKHVTCVDTFSATTNGQTQMPQQTTYTEFQRNLAPFEEKLTCLPFSSERANELMAADATFDVIFLDAMHDAVSVREDVLRWWPRVRPGGVLAAHDFGHTDFMGVQQAIDGLFGDGGQLAAEWQEPWEPQLVTLKVIRKVYS